VTHAHNEHSPNTDLRGAHGVVLQVETTRLLPLIILFCVLTGASLIGTAWSINMAYRAQERADLLQLEVESFKNVLHAAKLPTSAHLHGEAP
jgi:hypothetical protein